MHKKNKEKLINIFDIVPGLKEIFISTDPLETKRKRLVHFLTDKLVAAFNENPGIPSLEWVLTRDATRIFINILSVRNENLTGFSFLKYTNDLIFDNSSSDIEKPSLGFFAELEHLMKGIFGKTGIYSGKSSSFLKYEGIEAAKIRSTDLSKMGKAAHNRINSYPSGLDNKTVRRRSLNKSRILKYFDATDLEWNRWQWQVRHIIRDADVLKELIELTDEQYNAVKLAREYRIPFGITPYYLSLMDFKPDQGKDYALRAQVIPSLHYVEKLKEYRERTDISMDFMQEQSTSPIKGITRRYPMIVILKPILTCPQICVYCQRNWEIEDVYSPNAVLLKEKLENALEWIANTPEINEVLITGGDPFLLSNAKIENLLYKLSRNKNITRIRIGTRTPVTLPQRITDSLVKDINHFHNPGKREIIIITHFEHPYEITPQSMEAVQKFRRYGIDVYNQLVYTFYNSKKFEAAALRQNLRLIGVTPYYTFNTKGKEETDDFRVPIARLMQEQKEEARLMPGTVRTDDIVFNVPGLGKNNLNAMQHHDVISILPNGCRVYEFHPWEKILSLSDTFIHTDVSIYDYLKRLKTAGENKAHYKTIWYYY